MHASVLHSVRVWYSCTKYDIGKKKLLSSYWMRASVFFLSFFCFLSFTFLSPSTYKKYIHSMTVLFTVVICQFQMSTVQVVFIHLSLSLLCFTYGLILQHIET